MLQELDERLGLRKRLVEPFVPDIDPNLVSAAGFITGPLAGYFLWNRRLGAALVFLLLNALSDLIDGVIARKYKRVSKTGSLIDDLADRVSDISISLGLGGAVSDPALGAICALILVLNSYLSLQGLALFGKKAKFGLFSRANRTVFIIAALLVPVVFKLNFIGVAITVSIVLCAIIAFGVITIVQRALFLFSRQGNER